ncbi:MAG: cysteine--tRNA ligase [Rhizobiales bacterium]|nr:cysteine--tRNA ligase [Hyphomicrobiales bacterium]
MTLRLYNTLTRRKEDFTPLDPSNVRMYVCGPTVYDFAHIGNARPVIVFDVLYRLLRHLYPGAGKASDGSRVEYVRNITDVDDKINDRALRDFGRQISFGELTLNQAIRAVTEKTANQFQADVKALGCLDPTQQPRATEFIDQMIAMITVLLAKGNAYQAGGEVLFDVASMKDYGALSNRKLEDQQAGARVAVEAHKKNPGDFVLWKLSTAEEPGWESPWGRGRPGWHIECSAMSKSYLGEVFDIHGGGLDLIFPHHENELAQSRCAHGTKKMANIWMHNGFLQVEGQKMSKSLGNFVTINEVLNDWPGEVVRFNMLRTHYRQPIDWTNTMINAAQNELEEWVLKIDDKFGPNIGSSKTALPVSSELVEILCDDLNTPEVLAFLRQKTKSLGNSAEAVMSFLCDCEFLGLLDRRKLGLISREYGGAVMPELMVNSFDVYQQYRARIHNGLPGAFEDFRARIAELGGAIKLHPNGAIELTQDKIEASQITSLIESRNAARVARNWKESDRIRDELDAMGVSIKDNKDGTTSWEVKR